jgi:hypothetical protein
VWPTNALPLVGNNKRGSGMICAVGSAFLVGTLVILVPAQAGLVVAADSRVTNEKRDLICDEDFKLIEVNRGPLRTVATITGIAGMSKPSSNPNFCEHLRTATVWLDLRRELKNYLESSDSDSPSLTAFQPMAQAAFSKLPAEAIPYLKPLAGSAFATLVVASFDPKSKVSRIRYAVLSLTANLQPQIGVETLDEIGLDHSKMFYRVGEMAYADSQLQNGTLAKLFADRATLPFLTAQSPVREIRKSEAINAAIDFINAVSEATKAVPAPSAIGGPVDVLFIGDADRAERVRWK